MDYISLEVYNMYFVRNQERISHMFMNLDFVSILCSEDHKPEQKVYIFFHK